MKIYELRDVTSDENYYQHGMFSTKEKAIEILEKLKGDINEFDEDYVESAIFEHEVDSGKDTAIEVFRKGWEKNYDADIKEEWLEVVVSKKGTQ